MPNDCFEVRSFGIGLVPDGAGFKLVHHEIDRLIVIVRYDRRRPTGLTHDRLRATEPVLKLPTFGLFLALSSTARWEPRWLIISGLPAFWPMDKYGRVASCAAVRAVVAAAGEARAEAIAWA